MSQRPGAFCAGPFVRARVYVLSLLLTVSFFLDGWLIGPGVCLLRRGFSFAPLAGLGFKCLRVRLLVYAFGGFGGPPFRLSRVRSIRYAGFTG